MGSLVPHVLIALEINDLRLFEAMNSSAWYLFKAYHTLLKRYIFHYTSLILEYPWLNFHATKLYEVKKIFTTEKIR